MSDLTLEKLYCLRLPLTEYRQAHVLQDQVHQHIRELGGNVGCVIGLEHPDVVTIGRNRGEENILTDRAGLNIVETDRGGDVTVHMPGQLVVYPIIPVGHLGFGPKKYVRFIEDSIVSLLSQYGLKGRTDEHYPGIWVNDEKVCAVGVRIKERVSKHGFALNVQNSLELFNRIVPCGISDRGVTSMRSLGVEISCEDAWGSYLEILRKSGLNLIMISKISELMEA